MIHSVSQKNIFLTGLFFVAIAAVFVLSLQRKVAPVGAEQGTQSTEAVATPTAPEVKAASKTELEKHMALTSTNIIWFTNYYRLQYHLKPLVLSEQLRDSAYYKSLDMFNYQYFEHYRPGNHLGFDNFVDNQHYEFIKIGENLAKGDFTTSKEIVDAWMQSPEHKRNILDTAYTEIGVSVDYGVMNGERSILITQHFGKPSKLCPSVDSELRTTIKNLNKKMASLKQSIDSGGQIDDLIIAYNTTLAEREVLVAKYNAQVDTFDACILKGEQ